MSTLSKDIERARKADLPAYLIKNGYSLCRVGQGNYRWPGHGGLIIKDNFWHCFSSDEKGNAIDFLVKILGMEFKKAVSELLGYSDERQLTLPIAPVVKKLEIPKRVDNERRVFAYLTKKRFLPANLVLNQIESGRLYQDINGNCVFPCFNYDTEATGAILRGTADKRFAGLCPGHNPVYGWVILASSDTLAETLILHESPIDMLSFMVLKNIVDRHPHLLAMAGLRIDTVLAFLKHVPKVNKIIVAVDNDDAGEKFYERLKAFLAADQFQGILISKNCPKNKDWNEDLKDMKKTKTEGS